MDTHQKLIEEMLDEARTERAHYKQILDETQLVRYYARNHEDAIEADYRVAAANDDYRRSEGVVIFLEGKK